MLSVLSTRMTCTMYNNINMFVFTSHFIRLYLTCWLFEGHAKVHCTLHSLVYFSLYIARSVMVSHFHGSALTVFLCCVCFYFKYLMRSEWAISVILLVSQVRFTKKIHAFLSMEMECVFRYSSIFFPSKKHMANVKFVNTILIFDAQFNSCCSLFSIRIQSNRKRKFQKIHMILKQLRSEMMAIDLSRLAYFFNCLLLYDYYFRYFTLITRWSMHFSCLNRAKSTFHASNGFHLFLCCRFCFCWTANT